jgi:hypothetical protein
VAGSVCQLVGINEYPAASVILIQSEFNSGTGY